MTGTNYTDTEWRMIASNGGIHHAKATHAPPPGFAMFIAYGVLVCALIVGAGLLINRNGSTRFKVERIDYHQQVLTDTETGRAWLITDGGQPVEVRP
jgi:hypothetical protein